MTRLKKLLTQLHSQLYFFVTGLPVKPNSKGLKKSTKKSNDTETSKLRGASKE